MARGKKMRDRQLQKLMTLVVALVLLATPGFAQKKKDKDPLEDKNNPTLIGKRDINKGQLAFYGLDKEVALGRQLSADVDRSSKFVTDPLVTEYVNRVAQNIVLHSDAKVPFTIKVIDSNDVNAFALPGGFLYVNRGLLEAADNEAELAGVLSHEIAHVTARHGIENMSKGQLLNYASIPLIFFGGIGGYIVQQVASIAVPLTFLKFSRGAEKEADRLGAQYMWAAGYDPNALVTFFEKLQAKDKKKPGTISKVFSTHPMTGDRIKEVNELIPRFPNRSEYQVSSSEFANVRNRLLATSASTRTVGPAGAKGDGRPTLKRRPQADTENTTSDVPETDRPVLKRSGTLENAEPSATEQSSGSSDRPVLKRKEGDTGDKPTDSSGRPTLKPRTTP
jgi:beta-barrel assembly-enhancing protease